MAAPRLSIFQGSSAGADEQWTWSSRARSQLRVPSAASGVPTSGRSAKAMRDDQEKCLAAGANDYLAKPLDVEKLMSLIRVWMPK